MKTTRIIIAVGLALLATNALAHPMHGAGSGIAAGLGHPFLGLDHLLAMLAVGLWAVQQQGARVWVPPVAFVGSMIVGSLLAVAGVALPASEALIAISVLVLGLCVARAQQGPSLVLAVLVAGFALAHGYAHGIEMPMGAGWPYALGFVGATALLHGIGMTLAYVLRRQAALVKGMGAGTALAGAAMLLG